MESITPSRLCPACQLRLPADTPLVRYCPACGYSFETGQQPMGWVREGLDLRAVARRQRLLLWFVLILLLVQFAPFMLQRLPYPVTMLFSVGCLVLLVVMVVSVLRLLAALRRHVLVRILYALLLFAPCINLLILLIINGQATNALRRAGLRVGFMGVKDEEVLRFLGPDRCRKCGYSLIGNVSGICPECGTPTGISSANRSV